MSRTKKLVGRNLCKAVLALAITAVLPTTNAVAQTSDSVSVFDIPAGKLSDALDSFMSQSGAQILYKSDLVAEKKSQALRGSMDRAAALTQLLAGTGLVWEKANGSTFVIKRAMTPLQSLDRPQAKKNSVTENDANSGPTTLDTMVVTGTRIRGGTTPSPIIAISAQNIREEGFSDLGEAIRSVSQNFRGGQNPGVINGTAGNLANQNVTGGSGLNLRGLGPDATLTLLNGRRMSYGGPFQAVDISAIPVEAVDRLEIVADGASAIYGSDAVGGVGNVILKREFDGVTAGVRYGTTADGGLTTRDHTLTAGTTWSNGGFIATYKGSSTDPIYAKQRDYTDHLDAPTTIYPGSDLRSALVSAHQLINDRIELRLDAIRTERKQENYDGYTDYYYQYRADTETSLVSPSLDFSLGNDWNLSVGGAWGKDEFVTDVSTIMTATGVPSLTHNYCNCNESRMYEVSAEGPLFALGGGDARLAVGSGYRWNDFRTKNYQTNTRSGGDDSSRFAYAEINLPFVGPESNISGIHRLELTAAVRGENYDSFGRVTTPKFGLIYDPTSDFTIKASWGKSFKAPTLAQRYTAQYATIYPADWFSSGYAADATVLLAEGGSAAGLSPEKAKTWTASLSFHPESVPGLEADITRFHISYTDRVVNPIGNVGEALSNPIYSQFVILSPTIQQQEHVIGADTIFRDYSSNGYDPSDVVALIGNQSTNATAQWIKGIDLSGSYAIDINSARLTVRGSASWLDSTQQTTSTQNKYELAGTIFNPAKLNARIGLVWNQARVTASAFASYVEGVSIRSAVAEDSRKTASFTTFDTTFRYSTGETSRFWSGIDFALSAQNLFDRAPPIYVPALAIAAPYDSTNYSAIGRFLSISLSKHW